jgi:hypothetical protein
MRLLEDYYEWNPAMERDGRFKKPMKRMNNV